MVMYIQVTGVLGARNVDYYL